MLPVRIRAAVLGLGACLAIVGCGGGGSSSSVNEAIHQPVQSRGIKGEDPSTEAASTAAITSADCAQLHKLGEERLGAKLAVHSTPKPPLSKCQLTAPGTSIEVYLDSGFAAHQRYGNRIVETGQFNEQNPAGQPHPVPHVGEKSAYNADANWIPALRSLLAVRGNRWLTVTISVPGLSNQALLREAAVLARAGFKLTADPPSG